MILVNTWSLEMMTTERLFDRFLGQTTKCIFDIRVFHPNAPSYHHTQIASLFRKHKLEKKEYGDCIHAVESASFTPLVFSTFGGLGREATIFIVLLFSKHFSYYSHMYSEYHSRDCDFN